ncbi:hypothetical protein [Caulobacter segnis]|uniref:hypothetical protein n=1 Tax=Caulobacter segnis TaxID=88688 RepID=UPI00286540CA|nr:hypothetical protein [Caulobacter segnis]MDR6625247.1 hypothetical protein [Caulobacter segnis]
MPKTTTWWRNVGGLLAACVLTLLVVAPAIASSACVCDERPASAHQTIQADQNHDNAPCKAACCLGGHCHHGGSLLDAPVVMVAPPAPAASKQVMTPVHALSSRSPAPLDQPPRA